MEEPVLIGIKPPEGQQVRDPEGVTEFLPAGGRVVTYSMLWERMVSNGYVVEIPIDQVVAE